MRVFLYCANYCGYHSLTIVFRIRFAVVVLFELIDIKSLFAKFFTYNFSNAGF